MCAQGRIGRGDYFVDGPPAPLHAVSWVVRTNQRDQASKQASEQTNNKNEGEGWQIDKLDREIDRQIWKKQKGVKKEEKTPEANHTLPWELSGCEYEPNLLHISPKGYKFPKHRQAASDPTTPTN